VTDAFRPDQVVNERYRVLRRLGSGGMADVYLCEDLTLGRRVALKVLSSRFARDQQFIERFRREAKAAAGLNHPNLVAIHDWGEIDGTYFIVMEYVEGETLKELVRRRGRLNGSEALDIGLGLLAAVGYAHRHGVVHRDIKSQNILMDRSGTAKVTDFGIARAGDSGMTEAGSILGTAQYLAPEQARGEAVDERSDLYSVGIVLYEMLTGVVPFTGDTAVTVAMKHVNEVPPEPSEVIPGMPYALNQIVMKALAKDPALRYQTAEDFARDLRAAQLGGPVTAATYDAAAAQTQLMTAPPADATQVMARPAGAPAAKRRRSRRTLWIVLLLLAIIAASVGALLWTMSGERIDVPDVVGRSQAQATKTLQDAGFKVNVKDTYSDDYSVGLVARQSPDEGAQLKKGATVTIWVSRGAQTILLPDFRGRKAADVAAWLKDNGLEGRPKKGPSDNYAEGRVYQQDPAADTELARGETVTYWVSSGAPPVKVPDLIGASRADAIAQLAALGLVANVTFEPSTTYDVDQVIFQDPGEGTEVDKGSAVDLVVSSGPPSPSPSTGTPVEVPSVLYMDAATAQSTLVADGFVPFVKEKASSEPAGTVIKQTPEAGTMAAEGSTVTIWVAK
jgi:beta-lactam-binding protein with PASTA domain/predicted Ser/Thr protein kinase